jgi:alkylhydroperoxidase family enzyme
MRLPYTPNPPTPTTPSEAAIVDRIAARRAPRPLQPLDLTLLHSPPVADGWNSFLGAIRTQTSIPADLRELAISRVAVVNRAWYEWMHHAPLAVAAGVSEQGMEVVKREGALVLGEEEVPGGLNEKQWAVVCYTDEMTRNVQVRDGTFERLRGLFGEREVVEITATVGFFPFCSSSLRK